MPPVLYVNYFFLNKLNIIFFTKTWCSWRKILKNSGIPSSSHLCVPKITCTYNNNLLKIIKKAH